MFLFLKNLIRDLFKKKKPVFNVKEMECIEKTTNIKNGIKKIVHGDENYKVEITINENDGCAFIKVDKDIYLNEEDIMYLMKKYL